MKIYKTIIPREERLYEVIIGYVHLYQGAEDKNSLALLNRIRLADRFEQMPLAIANLLRSYESDLNSHRNNFRNLLTKLCNSFDLLVGIPSSKPFVNAFLDEARSLFPEAADLTNCFQKAPNISGGRSKKLADYYPHLQFLSPSNLSVSRGNVLIVDDVIADGTSSAAVIMRLLEWGVSTESSFTIVAPLTGTKEGIIPPLVN